MKQIRIENELRDIVERSKLHPGGHLPPERELCERLGVSRGTLRKALDVLEARGLVQRQVGRGTFAAETRPVAVNLIDIADSTSPWELMELRLMIEPQIALLAAMRASGKEIEHMRNCLKESEATEDPDIYEIWDITLHRTVAEAAHNQLVLSVFTAVNELRNLTVWGQLRRLIVTPKGRIQHWRSQHRLFVEAIANRNPKLAEAAARRHVEDVFDAMREGVARDPAGKPKADFDLPDQIKE